MLGGSAGDRVRFRRCVQDDKPGPLGLGLLQKGRKARMLRRRDSREVLVPLITPKGGARLGIEVEKSRHYTKGLGGNGKVRRYGRLSGSTFSAHDRQGFHGGGHCYLVILLP
jgi:hypothetical protein